MNIEYYTVNPTGNITALVTSNVKKSDYKPVASAIMKTEPSVEQVGFVNFKNNAINLNMSGGEFCGNATMCAAALFCELSGSESAEIPVTVFPYKDPFCVTAGKNDNGYTCECTFKNPRDIKEFSFSAGGSNYTFNLVSFEGIKHIVADNTLSESLARQVIKRLAFELEAPALGIMIYDSSKRSLMPLVFVPALDTLFLENSCASGSCALAAALPEFENKTDISEPGGIVCAQRKSDGIYLKTSIEIIEKHIGDIDYAKENGFKKGY